MTTELARVLTKMNLEKVFTCHPLLIERKREVRSAIDYVERQSHILELNSGIINTISNLGSFKNLPFMLIFDVFHFTRIPRVHLRRWKALAIAASKLDGTAIKFLYLHVVPTDVDVLDAYKIKKGLKVVVRSILSLGLDQNVCAVVSDRCNANMLSLGYLANYFPLLWDKGHLRGIMAKKYRTLDTLLENVYTKTYSKDTWEQQVQSSIQESESPPRIFQSCYKEQIDNLKKLLSIYFNTLTTPLTLNKVNSSDFVSRGVVLKGNVFDILEFIHLSHKEVFEDAKEATKFFARIVGVLTVIFNN